MHKPSWTFTLLSLGTTAERADAIEGDLIEEAATRGRRWLWWHTTWVSLRLFVRAFVNAPVQALLAGYAVYELAVKLQWWAIRPLLQWLRHDLQSSAALVLLARLGLWTLTGIAIGALLVRFWAAEGVRVAVVAIVLMLMRLLLLDSPIPLGWVLSCGALPLLATCLLAYRRQIRCSPLAA